MTEYKGSIELISGLTPKNGGKFPLVHAKDIEMQDGSRLSEWEHLPKAAASESGKLLQMKDGKWEAAEVAQSFVKTYIDEYITAALGGDY